MPIMDEFEIKWTFCVFDIVLTFWDDWVQQTHILHSSCGMKYTQFCRVSGALDYPLFTFFTLGQSLLPLQVKICITSHLYIKRSGWLHTMNDRTINDFVAVVPTADVRFWVKPFSGDCRFQPKWLCSMVTSTIFSEYIDDFNPFWLH